MMRAFAIAMISAVVGSSPATAENFEVMQTEFQPMIETSQGRLDLCGLHFSVAGRTVSRRSIGLYGHCKALY
jgi:hypothetical protein